MEGEPPSMCVVNARELFPVGVPKYDNFQGETGMPIPFTPLTGESVKYVGRTSDGLLGLSNYRLYVTTRSEERSIPIGLIESVESPDPLQLNINCKDILRVVKCSFDSYEICQEWYTRVIAAISPPAIIENYFAFPFYSWSLQWSNERNHDTNNVVPPAEWLSLVRKPKPKDDFKSEIERLQFDLRGAWRITQVNSAYELCPTYPRQLLVPASVKDEELPKIAAFRSSRRIPTVVWRHRGNGAVLARCSQPEVGLFGWRCSEDEEFIKAMSNACSCDSGSWTAGDQTPNNSSPEGSHEAFDYREPKKVLIVDARSYASAVTNKVRGGGCECSDYYYAEIQFMCMANIHVIRGSFEKLRNLCSSPPEHPKWLSVLEHTAWLHHLSSLFHASIVVVRALHKIGRPVLVHCSDGWDRTPQILATAELCLDPFYRTVDGFRILVEREWLNFGHKFAERNGHHSVVNANERCPVFIQWLDAVHQLLHQFPCSFEFSTAYLIKLAQHSYTCLFGTFLCNSENERNVHRVTENTFSVWQFLENAAFRNHLYVYNKEVLWPKYNVRDLVLWSEVYLSSLENRGEGRNSPGENFNNTDIPPAINLQEAAGVMIKTRSYGDLLSAGGTGNGPAGLNFRRLSDPSVIVDPIKLNDRTKPTEDFVDGDYCESVNDISIKHENQIENIQNETTNLLNTTNEETGYADHEYNIAYESNILQPVKNNMKNNTEDTLGSVSNTLNEISDIQEIYSNNKTSDIMNVKNISLKSTCNNYITSKYNGDHIVNGDDKNFNNVYEANLEQHQNGTHNGSDDDKDSITATEEDYSNGPSIETSTDTLVPHLENYRASNGQIVDVHWPYSECGTSGRNSQYSTPSSRGFSRAPSAPPASSPGIPATPPYPQVSAPYSTMDSMDGLGHGINEEGLRLQQLVFEHKMREDALKKELQSVRMSMMTHLCAQCYSRTDIPDRADESPAPSFVTEHTRCSYAWKPLQKLTWPDPDNVLSFMMDSRNAEIHQSGAPPCGQARGAPNTLVKDNSLNSLTDSVGPSGASDCSWEAVEDRPGYIHGPGGVLWVPDHAVSRCTSCETQFWLGRRKHHCRSCGCIFCADCSEHYAPLPTENLYTPVRLCTPCYHKQSASKSQLTEACKHAATDTRALVNTRPPMGTPTN